MNCSLRISSIQFGLNRPGLKSLSPRRPACSPSISLSRNWERPKIKWSLQAWALAHCPPNRRKIHNTWHQPLRWALTHRWKLGRGINRWSSGSLQTIYTDETFYRYYLIISFYAFFLWIMGFWGFGVLGFCYIFKFLIEEYLNNRAKFNRRIFHQSL